MKIAVTRFDYLRRGGRAWVRLEGDTPESGFDRIPTLEMTLHFAVRATQREPANDGQIVVRHPIVDGLYIVAWFPSDDVASAEGQDDRRAWPAQAAYRFKAVQLVANLVATSELETFGSAIPSVIP